MNIYKKFWKQKTAEQKVLIVVTIAFIALDAFIFISPYFSGYIVKIYAVVLVIQTLVKFLVLTLFNAKNIEHNAITSIPWIGGLYAVLFFVKKPPTSK